LNAGELSGAVGNDSGSLESALRFNPPDAVVRLLEFAFLAEVQHGKDHQPERCQGQQCRLQPVEEV
jgi:hypothetical protein